MKFNPLDILLPRESIFYSYLSEQVEVLIEGCKCFKTFVDGIKGMSEGQFKESIAAIKECEHRGDRVERRIIDELHKTFITPFDREDIHTIAINIDKAVDILNSITQKFEVYQIRSVPVNVCRFADLLLEISTELCLMVKALKEKGDIMKHVEKLHALENTGDHLFHWSMAELFDGEHNPIDIIKFKEVYEHLEDITNVIDHVGKLIRGVKVKLG
jgi:predicted phosphate transport protein (TIGR00153 family)